MLEYVRRSHQHQSQLVSLTGSQIAAAGTYRRLAYPGPQDMCTVLEYALFGALR